MAIVIRTLYNNQNWSNKCIDPFDDPLFDYRIECELNITHPKIGEHVCSGSCWEQTLCKGFYWGCNPQYKYWGERAYPGMKVFFIFRQRTSTETLYTLWATTTVKSIDEHICESGEYGKDGYNLMYFVPFKPLPRNQWISNLKANDIVGTHFGNGNYRYIDKRIESKLDNLLTTK